MVNKKKDLSAEEKLKIQMWGEIGRSTAEIAAELGRGVSTVRRFRAVLKELPPGSSPPPHQPGAGRPRATTKEQDERLRKYVLKNPRKTAKELIREVRGFEGKSARFVQDRLKRVLKIPSRSAAKKPLLTEKMKKKRVAFAQKYQHWTEQDWAKVMYSDESTFRQVDSRSVKVRRPSNISRYKHQYTVKTVKHPEQVMVWGCFSASLGRGGLYFLPKNRMMNGTVYKQVLEDHLLPFMALHKSEYFLQDGAPCHNSKLVKSFLQEQGTGFKVMDWPGNSPDLNPIENAWSYMKQKLSNERPKNLADLKEAIKKMWVRDLSLDYWKKLSDSMPRRLQLVIASKGDMTKY